MSHVRVIATYPVKNAPGVEHGSIEVEPDGLAGDRRKKRPVHLVGAEIDPEATRANFFLTVSETDLAAMVGKRVLLGEAVLDITEVPSACPGVYATVTQTGGVALDATLHVLE